MAAKTMNDFLSFGTDTMNAFIESSTIAAKGFESLTKTYSDLANFSLEKSAEIMKDMTSVKSPTDLPKVYDSLVKTSLENFVAEGQKIHELSTSIVTNAMEPLNQRVAAFSSFFSL